MNPTRLLAALTLGAALLYAAGAAEASTLVCESKSNEFHACPVNTSGGVRLTKQLSSQGCWQDDTWGYDQGQVWVTNGCRAEFQIGSTNSSSSNNSGALAAAAVVGLAAAAVIASNQHDDHHNNKNKNNNYNGQYDYNYDDNYNHRYNDDYYYNYDNRYREYDNPNWKQQNSRYGYNGYGGDPRRTFVCESHGGKRNSCQMPKHGHVEVYRQLSSNRCTYGRTWGTEGNHVWVDDGCRAEFAIY